MQVINCFAVSHLNVSEQVILRLNERIFCVLASEKLLLLEKPLDLVDCNLTFHMARDYIDMLVFADSFHVKASHRTALDFLVGKDGDLLLRVIEETHRAI